MDPDRLLAEINDLSRRNWDKLPPECAAADGRRLAGKINQLADWIGLGNRIPERWARAQRLGPNATHVVQHLRVSPLITACTDCGAEATHDLVAGIDVISHYPICQEVRP